MAIKGDKGDSGAPGTKVGDIVPSVALFQLFQAEKS